MPQLFYKPLEARIAQGKDDARLQAVANAKQQENVRYVNMSDYDKELNRQRLQQFATAIRPALAPAPEQGSDLTASSLDKAIKALPTGKSGVNWKDSKIIQEAVRILTNDIGYNLYPRDFDKMSFAEAIDAVKKADVSTEAFAKAIDAVVSKRLAKARGATQSVSQTIGSASAPYRAARAIKQGTEKMKREDPKSIVKNILGDIISNVTRTRDTPILEQPEGAMRESLGLTQEPGFNSTNGEKKLFATNRGFSGWPAYVEYKGHPTYYKRKNGKYIRHTGEELKKAKAAEKNK